jgi:probable addiction module antidote protein
LRSLSFASLYLTECLHDEDPKVFLIALRHVITAHGGMSKISKDARLNRESLYKALSEKGNPSLQNILSILSAIGIKMNLVKGKLQRAG